MLKKIRSMLLKKNLSNKAFEENIQKLKQKKIIENDIIDYKPYQLFKIELNSIIPFNPNFNIDNWLPPFWNNLYFLDKIPSNELSSDGYDDLFSPPKPYRYRLWKSGKLIVNSDIKLNDSIKLITSCQDIIIKEKNGDEFIEVVTKKEYFKNSISSLIDYRSIFYSFIPFSSKKSINIKKDFDFEFEIKLNPIQLFRYSALTYNSHLIHYNTKYTQEIENHKDLIVHGPFILPIALNGLYTRLMGFDRIHSISYNFISPLFVDTLCLLRYKFLKIKDQDGYICWGQLEDGSLLFQISVQLK